MSKLKVVIELDAYSSHVSESDMDEHLKDIARQIHESAISVGMDDCNRKVQVDYESQEDCNLTMRIDFVTDEQEKEISAFDAMSALIKRFRAEPDYAHSWHCNLAMSFYDSFINKVGELKSSEVHTFANEGASRFMKLAFGINTKNNMLNTEDKELWKNQRK